MCVDITYSTVKVLWNGHNKTAFTSFLHFTWNNTVLALNSCDKLKTHIMVLKEKSKTIA